jgi:hypothetical protein
MEIKLKSKVEPATAAHATALKKSTKKPKIWRIYICTFTQKPTAIEKKEKQDAFKENMKANLAKRRNAKKFKIRPYWKKAATPLFTYIVTLKIWEPDPPPGAPTATPMPPPPAPPAL